MKSLLPAACVGFVFLGALSCSGADAHPPEDLEVYAKSLFVQDHSVQYATIGALTHYEEGFDLLVQFVKKSPRTRNATYAVQTLKKFGADVKYRSFLVEMQEGKAAGDELPADLRRAVLEQLFEMAPKEYARPLAAVLTEHLAGKDKQISFSDKSFERIQAIVPHVDQKELYPLVPHLIRFLDAFFSQVRPKAHKCLVAITGENYAIPNRSSRRRGSSEAAEKYRELYYTKLLPQIRQAEKQD